MRNAILPTWALLATMLAGSPVHAQLPTDLGRRLLTTHIRPATDTLVGAASDLAEVLPGYCGQPQAEGRREAVEHGFSALVVAWSQVEPMRFGPLVEDNRFERFFFFPDPRGVTLRQVQALLAAAEPQRLEPQNLHRDSVALQGIPALEYALYGGNAATQIETAADAGRYRCAYAVAIAGHLHVLAAELQAAWSADAPLAQELARPAARNPTYRSTQEVATEVLKALSASLQYTRDSKLLVALGDSADGAKARRAPLWRSGLTTRAMAANLAGLLALYEASGLGVALGPDDRWIDDNVRAEALTAKADLDAVDLPFEQAVADPAARSRLEHAALVMKNLQSILVEYLAPALAVSLGFNALDGD